MLETIKFIKEHENWRDLLSQPPYCLSIKEDDDYAIFKYSQIDSDFNEQICRECRGLIIDLHKIEPIALSFYKFFNVQESFADRIYWKECRVQEKVDGSKMMVWYNRYKMQWEISTSSNLDAWKTPVGDFDMSFGDLFLKAVHNEGITMDDFYNLLDSNFCYTFELVSPESRVVIPYKKTKLYFIGLRYVPDFQECNPDSAKHICKVFTRPKEYKLDGLKACLNATERMGYDEEGFVVVDNNWNRVKIKSPAYVSAHYLKNNSKVSKSRILEIIEKNEQSEFLGLFPEYKEYFDDIENRYNKIQERILQGINDIDEKVNIIGTTQKDLAAFINEYYSDISGILFQFVKTDLIKMFIQVQWSKLSKEKKMNLLNLKMEKEDVQSDSIN